MNKAKTENWANLGLGTWFFISPWVFQFDLSETATAVAKWNMWIVGGAIAIFAAFAIQKLKPWEEWVNLFLGAWIILSPWIIGYTYEPALMWNTTLVGIAVTILAGMALPEALKLQEQEQ